MRPCWLIPFSALPLQQLQRNLAGLLSLEHCQWRGPYWMAGVTPRRAWWFRSLTTSPTRFPQFAQQPASGYNDYTLTCYNNLFCRGGHSFLTTQQHDLDGEGQPV